MSRTNHSHPSWKRGLPLVIAALVVVAVLSGCCRRHDGYEGGGTVTGSSLIGGGWGNFQGMATDNFYGLFHGFRGTAYDEVKSRVGAAGTVTAFAAAITEAPPTGNWEFTLFKNGVAQTPACSITGANTGCLDGANCVELVAGDEIAVRVVPTGATANAGGPRWTAVFTAGASCP